MRDYPYLEGEHCPPDTLKVGDFVRIRTDLGPGKSVPYGWNESMTQIARKAEANGHVFEVAKVVDTVHGLAKGTFQKIKLKVPKELKGLYRSFGDSLANTWCNYMVKPGLTEEQKIQKIREIML